MVLTRVPGVCVRVLQLYFLIFQQDMRLWWLDEGNTKANFELKDMHSVDDIICVYLPSISS